MKLFLLSSYALFKELLTVIGRQASDLWVNRLRRLIQYYPSSSA
jgi:hypothetical protein